MKLYERSSQISRRIFYWSFQWFFIGLVGFLCFPSTSLQSKFKEFPIFDGHVYNGNYYPRIDNIEWNYGDNPSDMEFHIYSKGKPIELSMEIDDTTDKKVMMVKYHIVERNEDQCRRVVAPGHFKKGVFKAYQDNSDPDFDNTIISMQQTPDKRNWKEIKLKPYTPCKEDTDDSSSNPQPTPGGSPGNSVDAPGKGFIAPPPVNNAPSRLKNGQIRDKDGSAPFSNW